MEKVFSVFHEGPELSFFLLMLTTAGSGASEHGSAIMADVVNVSHNNCC